MIVFMCHTLAQFAQSLLADSVATSFPVYTKTYHPNENTENC